MLALVSCRHPRGAEEVWGECARAQQLPSTFLDMHVLVRYAEGSCESVEHVWEAAGHVHTHLTRTSRLLSTCGASAAGQRQHSPSVTPQVGQTRQGKLADRS